MDLLAGRMTAQALTRPLPGADDVVRHDAGWLVALLGPVFAARGRPRRLQLGLTDELLDLVLPHLVAALPASREEILALAAEAGVPEGQARAYLLSYACMTGRACFRAEEEILEPLPATVAPEDPLTELGTRYLRAHGPATPADFASWSGLPLTVARKALTSPPPEEAPEPDPVPRVRLLGHLDPYLLAYRDRSFALDPAHAREVQRGGGFLQPTVLVDGRVAGTWSRTPKAGRLEITVDAFGEIPGEALDAELDALGEALGQAVSLVRPAAGVAARDDHWHGRA